MQEYTPAYIVKRLYFQYIRAYWPKILLAVGAMIVVALCSALNVKIAQPLLDEIFTVKDKNMLFNLAGLMLLVSLVRGTCEFIHNYLIKSVGQKVLIDMQLAMLDHFLHADLELLQKESSGKLLSRFTNDIALMRETLSTILVGIAKYFFTIIALVIVMFKLEKTLSAIVFIAFPLAILPIQYIGNKLRQIVNQTQEKLAQYTAKLDEVFLSIKVVKSYQGEEFEVIEATKITDSILNFYNRSIKLDALTSPITELLSGMAIASIIIYGGLKVMDGSSTTGSLLAFIAAFFSAYRPFKALLTLNVNLQEGLAAAKRIFSVLDIAPRIADGPNALAHDFTSPGITFEDVYLKFDDKIVFDKLNLHIPGGKTTAIVGESGSGKSSIVNLLLKFYLPCAGKILIDQTDVLDVKIKHLRQQIALVTQESLLFNTSIEQNIAYTTQASHAQIIQAADKSSASEFIARLPQKYDTIIGFQGYSLSGGQKQRIMLARAFLKKAPILILDEATSSLDPVNENMILESLKKHNINTTKIIISHRISAIKDVDHIIVMHQGRVVEQGSHGALISMQGEYWHLYNKQSKIDK